MTTVTEAIIERLARAGVRHIYGVPGGECNLDFIAAAEKLGVRFILTRNETRGLHHGLCHQRIVGRAGRGHDHARARPGRRRQWRGLCLSGSRTDGVDRRRL